MARNLTGKVNFVSNENILINTGRADGRSVSVPTVAFGTDIPEKFQKVDFKVDTIGPKVKRNSSGEVVFKSKSAYVSGFKVLNLWPPEMVIEEEDDAADNDYSPSF